MSYAERYNEAELRDKELILKDERNCRSLSIYYRKIDLICKYMGRWYLLVFDGVNSRTRYESYSIGLSEYVISRIKEKAGILFCCESGTERFSRQEYCVYKNERIIIIKPNEFGDFEKHFECIESSICGVVRNSNNVFIHNVNKFLDFNISFPDIERAVELANLIISRNEESIKTNQLERERIQKQGKNKKVILLAVMSVVIILIMIGCMKMCNGGSSGSGSSGGCQYVYSDGKRCGNRCDPGKTMCDYHINELSEAYNAANDRYDTLTGK